MPQRMCAIIKGVNKVVHEVLCATFFLARQCMYTSVQYVCGELLTLCHSVQDHINEDVRASSADAVTV